MKPKPLEISDEKIRDLVDLSSWVELSRYFRNKILIKIKEKCVCGNKLIDCTTCMAVVPITKNFLAITVLIEYPDSSAIGASVSVEGETWFIDTRYLEFYEKEEVQDYFAWLDRERLFY